MPASSARTQVERAPGDEHRGRVHDVLARGAFVDVAGGLSGDLGNGSGQGLDERWYGVARRPSVATKRSWIEAGSLAARDDGRGGLVGDEADPRLGRREGGLCVQHRL